MLNELQSPLKKDAVGLVLSGGGAKGAYQVGVVRGLAELGVTVDAVSGASIGSLNAAMVACAPSLAIAAERMHETWLSMGSTDNPKKIKLTGPLLLSANLISALASAYLPVGGPVIKAITGVGGLLDEAASRSSPPPT